MSLWSFRPLNPLFGGALCFNYATFSPKLLNHLDSALGKIPDHVMADHPAIFRIRRFLSVFRLFCTE
ncbi:hypothetical protein VTL71DRAFT_9611 [Oculimacula yallundae]|uniref:Uncharacterized protein n=1 Tax=Oculimacula yallundae TaxID=86028 RepID=A0ABR4BSP3_9HELO